MADPAPLTDDGLAAIRNDLQRGSLTWHQADLLVATVEQARRERDAAYAVIRRLLDGWEPLAGQWRNEAEVDVDGVAVRAVMTVEEWEAIRRAQTGTEGGSDE